MAVNVGPKIGIDGEPEFRKQLNNIIQQCKTLDSEMKAVTSSFDANDQSQEKLSQQSEVLSKQIQTQTQRIELLQKGLQESANKFGEADTRTLKWSQAVNEANTVLNRMSRELESIDADGFGEEARDAADAAEDMSESFSDVGDIVAGNLIADGIGRVIDAMTSAVEETKEYRRVMASLEVSSQNAGYSASETADTYRELFGVLGDNQTAATTTANLQALGLAQSDLEKVTNATIGAWATYGDSIPIDGLAEAINETIKTGTVTGNFADVLNWAGTSEDDFNASLQSTNDTTERANMVLKELSRQGLDKAGRAWQENNKSLVEANKATADQQEALSRLAEVAEPVLTKLTALAADFINFIVDSKEAVITTIAGIGAGFAAWKVTDIISKAKSAMDAFTASIKANPVGLIATAASAAVGVIAAAVSQIDVAKTKTDEIVEDAKATKKSMDEAGKSLSDSVSSLEGTYEDMEATAALASSLGSELESLASDTSRTADEQARMEVIVSELNEIFPDMGLAIDDVTGALNMGSEEIKKYIDNAMNLAKVEAVQEKLKDVAADLVDAEVERTKALSESGEAEDQLRYIEEKRLEAASASEKQLQNHAEAQRNYSEAVKTGAENVNELKVAAEDTSEAMIEYNGQIMTVSSALAQMDTDQAKLTQSQLTLKNSIAESDEQIQSAQETVNTYTGYIDSLNQKTGENTTATQTNTTAKQENATAASISTQSLGAELQAFLKMATAAQNNAVYVTESMLNMQNTIASVAQSQLDLFGAIEEGTEINAQTVVQSMQTQVDAFNNWGTNLATLADSTKTTTNGLTVTINEGLLQYLAEMGPEGAEYIAAFNQMTGDELAKANQLWTESIDIQSMSTTWGQELQTSVGQLAAGTETAWNNLGQQMNAQANKAGKYTGQGFIDAVKNITSQAANATEDLGNESIKALNSALGVASPSEKTKQSGRYTVQGFTMELRNGISDARRASTELADAATSAIQNINISVWRNSGRNASSGLAAGILAGRSEVISAAAEVAQAAANAARATLDINSPSKVFEEIGEYSSEGFAIGFDGDQLKRQVSEIYAMQQKNFSSLSAARSNQNGGIASAVAMAIRAELNTIAKKDADYMRIIDQMSKRPIYTYMDVDGQTWGRGFAPYITTAQKQETKIRNWVNGVKA